MSRRKRAATADVAAPPVRQLPAKASLALERKRAKTLLRELHAAESEAVKRLRAVHPAHGRTTPSSDVLAALKLADAQIIIAREYGFTSWPRFARYFADLERESYSPGSLHGPPEDQEGTAKSILAGHRDGRVSAGRMLAGFVPRFYGKSVAEVFASEVTIEDARLVVARQHHSATWEQLCERATANERFRERHSVWDRDKSPVRQAWLAISAHDLDALGAILESHPDLLHPAEEDERYGQLARQAIANECKQRTPEARMVTEWLASRGVDIATTLNRMLLSRPAPITTEDMEYLLDRGADPNWVPSNGITILEHCLLSFRDPSPKTVELIARRVVPRSALWIAAGLGDIDGMRPFFDRHGKPNAAAYRDRPPFGLVGSSNIPMLPEPDDGEVLSEVSWVALLNNRVEAIGFLLDHGLPIDHVGWGTPLLNFAVMTQRVALVEYLVKRGANLDLKGWQPYMTARELARDGFLSNPDRPGTRRIFELCCGGDPDAVLAEADARRPEPQPMKGFLEALELAGDDAARREQSEIHVDNVFVGLLRQSELPLAFIAGSGADLVGLRAEVGDRLLPAADRLMRAKLPLDAAARVAIKRAFALAQERRHDYVATTHLLQALVEDASGPIATLVVSIGANHAELLEYLGRA
jgi:hypothetical protein